MLRIHAIVEVAYQARDLVRVVCSEIPKSQGIPQLLLHDAQGVETPKLIQDCHNALIVYLGDKIHKAD
jgi:hypothetical protein